MRPRPTSLVTGLVLVVAACSAAATPAPTPGPAATPAASATPAGTPAVTAPPASLTVYAAASLTDASARIKTRYERDNPGTTLTFSLDSSTALETRIEQGAPADILLSADTTNPQRLVDRGLADGNVIVFAGNLLTIVVPAANPARLADPGDLARTGVKIIACGDSVPCGRYGAMLVANLAGQTGYPADFAARYAANIVSKESSVTSVLTKVELGEGDAGIVYVTDARGSSKVKSIQVPDGANVQAGYGGVIVKASKHLGAARAFMAWLSGEGGSAVLAELGFLGRR